MTLDLCDMNNIAQIKFKVNVNVSYSMHVLAHFKVPLKQFLFHI